MVLILHCRSSIAACYWCVAPDAHALSFNKKVHCTSPKPEETKTKKRKNIKFQLVKNMRHKKHV